MAVKTESRRVGARQWKALLVLDDADPQPLTPKEIRMAIGMDQSPAHVRTVLSTLEAHGLVRHACQNSQHTRLSSCLYRITERGQDARLGDQGGLRSASPPLAALSG